MAWENNQWPKVDNLSSSESPFFRISLYFLRVSSVGRIPDEEVSTKAVPSTSKPSENDAESHCILGKHLQQAQSDAPDRHPHNCRIVSLAFCSKKFEHLSTNCKSHVFLHRYRTSTNPTNTKNDSKYWPQRSGIFNCRERTIPCTSRRDSVNHLCSCQEKYKVFRRGFGTGAC